MSSSDTSLTDKVKPLDSEDAPERSRLSFSLSELWQQIPKPSNNPANEAVVIIEKQVIFGEEFGIEQEYLKKIESLIWLTYRTGFEPIPKHENGPHPLQFVHSMVFNKNPLSTNIHSFIDNENFTTDVGWGCMIRTSQALLANAYQKIVFNDYQDNTTKYTYELKLIDLFKDNLQAPFSIHNFIKVANELPLQVKPGQWFGPNAASLSIQRLCNKVTDNELDGVAPMKVVICENSDLYDEQFKELFLKKGKINVLVLLPVRLGIDKTNKFYFASILNLLNCKESVGIAGGRPSSSFYFFGYDNDDLLYLDPHYPQSSQLEYESYHTNRYQRLKISEVDPSMLIGILLQSYEEYEKFKKFCTENDNKIVHFAEKVSDNTQSPSADIDFDNFDEESDLDHDLHDDEMTQNNSNHVETLNEPSSPNIDSSYAVVPPNKELESSSDFENL